MAISAQNSITLKAPIASNPHYTLTAEFIENSTEVSSNVSSITCKATLSVDNTSSFAANGGTLYIYWYDNNEYSNGLLISSLQINSLNASSSKYIDGTRNITHKSDGTLDGYAKAVWTKTGSNNAVPVSGNVSTSNTSLTTIPRKSTISVSKYGRYIADFIILIDIDRKSSSFTDTITWSCGNLSENVQVKGTATKIALYFESYAYTHTDPPSGYTKVRSSYSNEDLMNLIPNSTSQIMTFYTNTYNGNTNIGWDYDNFTYEIYATPYYNNFTYSITDSLSQNLTGESDVVIKGISNVQVTNTPLKESNWNDNCTISSYIFAATNMATIQQVNNSYTFNGLLGSAIKCSIIDSRGKSISETQYLDSAHFLEYEKPAITSLTAERTEATSSTINWEVNGIFWNDDFGSVNNTLHVYYRYKINNGSYGSYTEVTPTISSNDFTYSGTLTISADNEATLDVKVVDSTNTEYTLTTNIPKGKSIFDIGDGYFNVNGVIAQNGDLLDNRYQYKAVSLYSSQGGSGNYNYSISLSDDIANYKYVEIIFQDGDGIHNSMRTYTLNQSSVDVLLMTSYHSNGYYLWIRVGMYSLSGTTLTQNGIKLMRVSGAPSLDYVNAADQSIGIKEVIGYYE